MHIRDVSTPVVVLKAEHYGGLGIIRSLARQGIRTYAIDANKRVPAFASRYCAGKFVWDIDSAPPEETSQFLLQVGRRLGRKAVLLPTSDEMALIVADHAEALREYFIIPAQEAQLMRSLCSKKEMSSLAKQHGIPVPESFFPETRDDVATIVEQLTFPALIKGVNGALLEKRTGRKALVVQGERELLEYYEAMEEPLAPYTMIQEYIPREQDTLWMFNGYFDRRSECRVAFTATKIRQNPAYCGMTSLGVSCWNETVVTMTERFMKAIGYCGILDVDYCYDVRDKQYKIVDVNPRIGATFRLFVGRNGVDVAQTLYLDLTGQPVPKTIPKDGRKWIVEDKDLLSSYHYIRDGKLTIWKWLRSLHGISEAGYFDLGDLRPFWRMVLNHCKRSSSRLWKRRNKRQATSKSTQEPFRGSYSGVPAPEKESVYQRMAGLRVW